MSPLRPVEGIGVGIGADRQRQHDDLAPHGSVRPLLSIVGLDLVCGLLPMAPDLAPVVGVQVAEDREQMERLAAEVIPQLR